MKQFFVLCFCKDKINQPYMVLSCLYVCLFFTEFLIEYSFLSSFFYN